MRFTRLISTVLSTPIVASAHCDLPCGVYDPAQARIEAESVKAIAEKYQANDDPEKAAQLMQANFDGITIDDARGMYADVKLPNASENRQFFELEDFGASPAVDQHKALGEQMAAQKK